MTMFDIEDCKNVELEGNKTSNKKLAKIKSVENLKAKNNEVDTPSHKENLVEFKPSWMGFSLNFNVLWRRLLKK